MDKGDNLAFHLIQSFKPGEVDAETAHRLGQQFANEVLKGKYEYVISTHVDKIIFITISSSTLQALLIITSTSLISGATINSAESVIVSAMKMDLPPVCHPEKKEKAIKRTWNIIVAPVGKPNYVLQLIRQSGLPSTMRNFYKNAVSRIRSPPRKASILPCTGAEKLHLYEISRKLLFGRKCSYPLG